MMNQSTRDRRGEWPRSRPQEPVNATVSVPQGAAPNANEIARNYWGANGPKVPRDPPYDPLRPYLRTPAPLPRRQQPIASSFKHGE